MPPFAICSNERCSYLFDFRGELEGTTRLPPEFCPNCTGRVLYFCRRCSHPIAYFNGKKTAQCIFCRADVRTGRLLGQEDSNK